MFKPLQSMTEVKRQARLGAIAGWVFLLSLILNIVVILFGGVDPWLLQPIARLGGNYLVTLLVVEAVGVVYFTWQLPKGDAVMSSSILIALATLHLLIEFLTVPRLAGVLLCAYVVIRLAYALRAALAHDRVAAEETAQAF